MTYLQKVCSSIFCFCAECRKSLTFTLCSPEACASELFTVVSNSVTISNKLECLSHPKLIFAGKARSLPLGWSSVWDFTCVGSRVGWSISRKYYTRLEVTIRTKHSSLLQYRINYDRKKLHSVSPPGVRPVL
jgi:hypothetical protein